MMTKFNSTPLLKGQELAWCNPAIETFWKLLNWNSNIFQTLEKVLMLVCKKFPTHPLIKKTKTTQGLQIIKPYEIVKNFVE